MTERCTFFKFGLMVMLLLFPKPSSAAEIMVFAASSLQEVGRLLAADFQQQHPAQKLIFNFAGSQMLRTQIEQGAPADVFISADGQAMEDLVQRGLVSQPQRVTGNRLILALLREHQDQITRLADLATADLLLAAGNQNVPIGRYTEQMLACLAADVSFGSARTEAIERMVITRENKVKAIVAKLRLGAVDAGIVYQTDIPEADAQLQSVPVPESCNPTASYPAALVSGGQAEAEIFFDYLFSQTAQDILETAGFLTGKQP